jgi:hypothetical protein
MGTRPRVLITAFRLYGIAIYPTVATEPRHSASLPNLAFPPANHNPYWLSLYNLLGMRRLFCGLCSILADVVDAGGLPKLQAYLRARIRIMPDG